MMPKGMKSGNSNCKSGSHKMFKDKAKIRIHDLQIMFSNLQNAMKESSSVEVAVIGEQMHQMLREFKSELHEPSPASSLQGGGSLVLFGSDMARFLRHGEEEDDATSSPAAPKPEPDAQNVVDVEDLIFHEEPILKKDKEELRSFLKNVYRPRVVWIKHVLASYIKSSIPYRNHDRTQLMLQTIEDLRQSLPKKN